MAFTKTQAWEVRTTGSDSNGGGFNTASAGTDYSQQDAAHVTFNGSTITASGTGNTVIILTGYTVSATDIGNTLNITGGTNFNIARFWITAVNTGTNSWTLSSASGTGAVSSMTGTMGGGLLTIAQALTVSIVADQRIYVKSGTYNITTALLPGTSGGNFQTTLLGYITNHTTVPTGASRPTISTGSNVINAITITAATGWNIQNFIISSSSGGLIGLSTTSAETQINNVKMSGFATGISYTGTSTGYVYNSEITSCTTAGININANLRVVGCWIHDMTCVGVTIANGNVVDVVYCLISNCTGATSDGILDASNSGNATRIGNTIYGSGRDGMRFSGSSGLAGNVVLNNILANNTGFGINISTADDSTIAVAFDFNGYYSNTAGNYNNLAAGPHDSAMTASPFNSPGSNDFSLNTSTFGGTEARNTGFPGTLPGAPGGSTGYNDMGVYHHLDNVNPAPTYTVQILMS